MLKKGIEPSLISEITHLTIEEIKIKETSFNKCFF